MRRLFVRATELYEGVVRVEYLPAYQKYGVGSFVNLSRNWAVDGNQV